jgi:hypothetical protein
MQIVEDLRDELKLYGLRRTSRLKVKACIPTPHLVRRNDLELGGDYFLKRQSSDAYRRRLISQLERMGFDVNLVPKAA